MKFHYLNGLEKLVDDLRGDENVYLGIRPSGFHSGNALTLVVYPIMMCKLLLSKRKIKPNFTFYLFLNDWEQDEIDGTNPKLFPFNIFPKKTTLQHIDKLSSKKIPVSFWLKFIEDQVKTVKDAFPSVTIIPVKNSEMKSNNVMKKYLLKTLDSSNEMLEIFDKNTDFDVQKAKQQYVLAVCPKCHFSRGTTQFSKEKKVVLHKCDHCSATIEKPYEFFDYWFYHKPLAIPRIEAFNIDLCITGSDHEKENDYQIRKDLIKLFNAKVKKFKTLYTPMLVAGDGNKMGKSKKNTSSVKIEYLLKKAENNRESILNLH